MKRFYKAAAAAAQGAAFQVQLDGRPVKTPARATLALPSLALAEAIAAEWDGQPEEIDPKAMPLMSLACTGLDLIAPRRQAAVDELADYGGTDLLCYRVEDPAELRRRQEAHWGPLLAWAGQALEAPLSVTTEIAVRPQPEDALRALRRAVAAHDDLALSGLGTAVRVSGSLVAGLALSHGRIDAAEAFEVAELDATYQMELWGEDREALDRRAALKAELEAAERFLKLSRDA